MKITRFALGIRFAAMAEQPHKEFARKIFEGIFSVLTLSELEDLTLYGGADPFSPANVEGEESDVYLVVLMGGKLKQMRKVYHAIADDAALDMYMVHNRPFVENNRLYKVEGLDYFGQVRPNGRIEGGDGTLDGLSVPKKRGRRKPVGTGEFEIVEIDSVIGAVGQTVDWGTLDVGALKTTKKNTAEADSLTYQTAQPDIFVGGDCYTGPKFAIDAIAAGKEAAISLHRYVHPGQTLTAGRDRREYRALDKEHAMIGVGGFDREHRQTPGYNAAKAKTFADARVTFTEEQVRKECARCLGCGATKVDSYLCIGCGLCTTKCKFDAIHLKKVRDWHAAPFEAMPIKVAENLVKRTGGIVKKAVTK